MSYVPDPMYQWNDIGPYGLEYYESDLAKEQLEKLGESEPGFHPDEYTSLTTR